jgi:hypothetical protein
MLDRDLTELYGVETKRLKEQLLCLLILRLGEKRYAKLMPMKSFIDNSVRWPTAPYKLLFFFLTHLDASLYSMVGKKVLINLFLS